MSLNDYSDYSARYYEDLKQSDVYYDTNCNNTGRSMDFMSGFISSGSGGVRDYLTTDDGTTTHHCLYDCCDRYGTTSLYSRVYPSVCIDNHHHWQYGSNRHSHERCSELNYNHNQHHRSSYCCPPSFMGSSHGEYWSKQQSQQQQSQQNMQQQQQQPPPPQQIPRVLMSNYQQSIPGPSTASVGCVGTVAADPLNALQHLTVSAGQSAQMMSMGIRVNPSMYGSQIRPRTMSTPNIHRPIEQYSMSQSATQQMGHSQIQQGIVINNPNIVPGSTIRVTSNNIVLKSDSGLTQSPVMYTVDANPNVSGQITPAASPQLVSKNATARFVQYGPTTVTSISQQHPQTSRDILQSNQSPAIMASPSSSNQSSVSNVGIMKPQNITDEESKKVREEISRLKEKYLKILKITVDATSQASDEEKKVWSVLRSILENPDSISKPLSLRHITKIEQHLIKAEQFLMNSDPAAYQSCRSGQSFAQISVSSMSSKGPRLLNQKGIPGNDEPFVNKQIYKSSELQPDGVDSSNESINSNSLDTAFDNICHQLMKIDKSVVKKVQKNLQDYLKRNQRKYQHLIPRRLLNELDEDNCESVSESKRKKLDLESKEKDEFSFIDDVKIDGLDQLFVNDDMPSSTKTQSLITNMDFNNIDYKVCDLDNELKILQSEFDVKELQNDESVKNYFKQSESENGKYFAISFKSTFAKRIPPLIVKIPENYAESAYTEWNLNIESYIKNNTDLFLKNVADIIMNNFSRIDQCYQWTGIPLTYVVSVYKKSILEGISSFQMLTVIED